MLKLKFQYFGHLMWRIDSLEKTLMLGKIEGKGRRGWQRMRWLDGITDSMELSKLWEIVKNRKVVSMLQSTGSQSQTWLSDWTTTQSYLLFSPLLPQSNSACWASCAWNPLFLELASCGSVLWEVEPTVCCWCTVWTQRSWPMFAVWVSGWIPALMCWPHVAHGFSSVRSAPSPRTQTRSVWGFQGLHFLPAFNIIDPFNLKILLLFWWVCSFIVLILFPNN